MLNKEVSRKECFMRHDNSFNHLHHYPGLFHQYVIDMAGKIASESRCFIRTNQTQVRSENYIHLRHAVDNAVAPGNLEQLCILPSSFAGRHWYMMSGAIIYIRHYSRSDVFVTFTCKRKLNEIKSKRFLCIKRPNIDPISLPESFGGS